MARAVEVVQRRAARERLLVVPFDNVNREGRLYWLTEASALLVTRDLQVVGLDAISRDERLRAFERLQLPPVASLSEATVIRVGQLVGAADVITGGFEADGSTLTVKARRIRLDTARISAEVTERGPLEDLFAIFDRVSRALLSPGAVWPERIAHEPLPAFENLVKGLLAESPAAQVRFLDSALKLAPDYDAARIALWQVYTAQGEHAKASAAVLAVPGASPLGRRARFLAALSRIRLKQYDEAFQGLKTLLDEGPSAALYNDLGVVQLRRPATAQAGRATYYFNKAVETARDDPDYAFNLGYAYWFERHVQSSVYYLKECVRRNPADGDAHYVLGAALQSSGASVEADREKELARQLSSKYRDWERRPSVATEPVPHGLERLREEIDSARLSLVDSTLAPAEKRDQEDLASFHLDRARRLFEQHQDREAIDALQRSLYIAPYQPEAHLLLGRIHLRAGRLREAAEALKISLWSQETAAAHVVLAEVYLQTQEPALAAAEIDRALALDPKSAEALALRARLK